MVIAPSALLGSLNFEAVVLDFDVKVFAEHLREPFGKLLCLG